MKEEPHSTNTESKGFSIKNKILKLIQNIHKKFSFKLKNKEELEASLKEIYVKGIIEKGTLNMLEGALKIGISQVRDIMIPKSQMVIVHSKEALKDFIPRIIESSHSRFPVMDTDADRIIGILLAKDLLPRFFHNESDQFDLLSLMRPAVLIPESKKLNFLLDEFRMNRHHMAIVVDEYGEVTGLVTIEDVLEEIVGEIEDETDDQHNPMIEQESSDQFKVSALIPIEEFNQEFSANFSKKDFDTLGGILTHHFGKIPKKKDSIVLQGYKFLIISTEKRRIKKVRVSKAV